MRTRHPFEGQTLETLAWVQRRGVLCANVILPDGTRVMVPATWTDYGAQQQSTEPPATTARGATLGSISELLHAHSVVAHMLAQVQCADAERVKHEEVEPNAAATAELSKRAIKRIAAGPKGVADALNRTAKRSGGISGPLDRKGCRSERRDHHRRQNKKGGTR